MLVGLGGRHLQCEFMYGTVLAGHDKEFMWKKKRKKKKRCLEVEDCQIVVVYRCSCACASACRFFKRDKRLDMVLL